MKKAIVRAFVPPNKRGAYLTCLQHIWCGCSALYASSNALSKHARCSSSTSVSVQYTQATSLALGDINDDLTKGTTTHLSCMITLIIYCHTQLSTSNEQKDSAILNLSNHPSQNPNSYFSYVHKLIKTSRQSIIISNAYFIT